MQHRVETAKGKLTISSAPGQGTRLSASLPTAAAAATPSPASELA
jgi:hypothetical protein